MSEKIRYFAAKFQVNAYSVMEQFSNMHADFSGAMLVRNGGLSLVDRAGLRGHPGLDPVLVGAVQEGGDRGPPPDAGEQGSGEAAGDEGRAAVGLR